MRKPDVTSTAPEKFLLPVGSRDQASVELVCLALALALFVLAFRIADIW
jgi:hypothetical protein